MRFHNKEKSDKPVFRPQSKNLLDQVMRHPSDMGKPDIERFLSHLAANRNVASATQSQALNTIIFLYKRILD